VQKAVDEFGQIDVLINNAAFQMAQPGSIEDISTEQFDRVFKTNIYATFWLSKAAIPHMQPGASIINTTNPSRRSWTTPPPRAQSSPSRRMLRSALPSEGRKPRRTKGFFFATT
jgi:NAD(P)-dependent dehydrogenase (short-subunit alcohol dehydrogenase family)